MPSKYSAMDVVTRTGATYRQVDYWARTGLIEPSIGAEGSGSRRLYSAQDLWHVAVVKTLLDAGVSLTTARDVYKQAAELGEVALSGQATLTLNLDALAHRLAIDPPTHLRLVGT